MIIDMNRPLVSCAAQPLSAFLHCFMEMVQTPLYTSSLFLTPGHLNRQQPEGLQLTDLTAHLVCPGSQGKHRAFLRSVVNGSWISTTNTTNLLVVQTHFSQESGVPLSYTVSVNVCPFSNTTYLLSP